MSAKNKIKSLLKIIFSKRPINMTVQITQLAPTSLLEGRCAVITGGSSGIGLSVAEAMLSAGASVIITGRNESKLLSAVEKLQRFAKKDCFVFYECMDISDIKKQDIHWKNILGKVGNVKIDILVNNAGTNASGDSWSRAQEDSFDKVIDTNLKGTYFLSNIVAHYMVDNKIQGNILNVASSSSLRPANSAYILSKWGVRGLTLGMAKTLIKYGIVVNGVAPGPTATPLLHKEQNDSISLPKNPLGRFARPEEIANMVVILTSNMGRVVVGDIVYMTGGAGIITNDDAPYTF